MLLKLLVSLSLALSTGGATIDLPLTGEALAPDAVAAVEALPGVESVRVDGATLVVSVRSDADVSLRAIERTVAEHSPSTTVDTHEIVLGPHTIFQLDAGVCFFCAEEPINQTLSRFDYIEGWSVVDYHERGRLRFRVDTVGDVRAEQMDVDSFEDLILTSRYDGQGPPDLYWPTGGVEWRPDEQTARREATASKKPLMIFPTAGT